MSENRDELFEIERGVPVDGYRSKSGLRYPWAAMTAGDSFRVPRQGGEGVEQLRNRLSASAKSWLRDHRDKDYRIATRIDGDGIRIWFLARNGNGAAP